MQYREYYYNKLGNTVPIIEYRGNFIVLKGTNVNPRDPNYDRYYTKRQRYCNRYIRDGVLLCDVAFNSLTTAAGFIYGKNSSKLYSSQLKDFTYIGFKERLDIAIKNKEEISVDEEMTFMCNDLNSTQYSDEESIVRLFDSNPALMAGAAEMHKTALIGSNIGRSIVNELKPYLSNQPRGTSQDSAIVSVPLISELANMDISKSIDDLIEEENLNELNVRFCIDMISQNRIPVLVGLAGCGKTYTAKRLSRILLRLKSDCGSRFDKMYTAFIPCTHSSHNEMWGSYDAVSHKCVGKFRYVWEQAEKNRNNLYYIILDELLDMQEPRKVFGDSFPMLSELPNNIVIVGTGNNELWDSGNQTHADLNKDEGLKARFYTFRVKNILEVVGSKEFNIFFDSLGVSEGSLCAFCKRFVRVWADKYNDEYMLVPRKVVNFIKGGCRNEGIESYKEYLRSVVKADPYYFSNIFATKRPMGSPDIDSDLEELISEIE